MSNYTGEYGGVVKREIKNGGGKRWIPGAVLTPEDVASWPLSNRIALHTSGMVDWYGPPAAAEMKARESVAPEKKAAPAPTSAATRPERAATPATKPATGRRARK